MKKIDVLIIGAGAAGLMCAIEAGKRGRHVLVVDHSNKVGKKILMSGGGRCNFTNYHIEPAKYLSHNPHFVKSALSRYTQWDFIDLVEKYQIPYYEKTLGQLFCKNKSKDIVNLLLTECQLSNVTIRLNESIQGIKQTSDNSFIITSHNNQYHCQSLVIATGGLSIPTLGASPFGYHVAEQFGMKVWPTRAGLVPLTLHHTDKQHFESLSGVATPCIVQTNQQQFAENILFTHRGLSGPAILQISSYWSAGELLHINLLPQFNLEKMFQTAQIKTPLVSLKNWLGHYLPKRLLTRFIDKELLNSPLKSLPPKMVDQVSQALQNFQIKPNGTEGYRTAEVTIGGVDCDALSSKTMEVKSVKGLYFIGEVLDVCGWLGGYNFQWAWSSGWAAGQVA